jgi:pimeloyl-ACP methyl ester carboxylesterase
VRSRRVGVLYHKSMLMTMMLGVTLVRMHNGNISCLRFDIGMFHPKKITIDGYRMHYYDSEAVDKPAAVLVHGAGASSRYLMPLAAYLQERFRVVVPDLPGSSRSEKAHKPFDVTDYAQVLHDLIGRLGLERPVLIGNSFGCQIIAATLAEYPDDASAAVFLGPTVNRSRRTLLKQAWDWVKNARHERRSAARVMGRDYRQTGLRGVWRMVRAALHDRIEDRLTHVTVPVLLLRGELDPFAPPEWLAELVERLSRATVAVIPGAPHALNYSAPEAVSREITEFIFGKDAS